MYDIIFCTLPVLAIDQIYSAPALLKGIVKSAGFNAKTFDFGMDLYKFCNKNVDQFTRIQNYFITQNPILFDHDKVILNRWYDHVASTLQSTDTKYIGFSVFSSWTHRATLEVLLRLQQLGLSDKVVLGGRGLKTNTHDVVVDLLPKKSINDRLEWFGTVLKNKRLVQHVIIGDGENAIVEFLKNNAIDEINFVKGFNFPWPDYNDYNFDDYQWSGTPTLQVIGSKGCVRDCDFCDVGVQFGNYQFKDGNQFAQELIELQQQYKINKFTLVDSLSNGSMKHFKQFISTLAQHNESAEHKITWSGQYICRDMRNTANIDEFYRLLKLSGAQGLTIGAESGSNHVLKSINKKSTVEALFFEIEKFKQNDITCHLLTFVGHWSERHVDFEKHCEMLLRLAPYARYGTVSGILLGEIFNLLHGTPSWHNSKLIRDSRLFSHLWVSETNRSNTLKVRVQRRLVLYKLSKLLKLPVIDEESSLQRALSFIENKVPDINNFFQQHGTAAAEISDIDKFINHLVSKNQSIELDIELDSYSSTSDPCVTIAFNQQILKQDLIQQGNHKFHFEIPIRDTSNIVSINMTNKDPTQDTVVDSDGNIVKDKFIKINSIKIDNYDLFADAEFFYKNFTSSIGQEPVSTKHGLWFDNETLSLRFDAPFVLWYADRSNKNVSSTWLDIKNAIQVSKAGHQDIYQSLFNVSEQLVI